MKTTSKFSDATDLMILKNRLTLLEGEIKHLKNNPALPVIIDSIPERILILRTKIQKIKNNSKMSRGVVDDDCRLLSLQCELGRLLLIMEE